MVHNKKVIVLGLDGATWDLLKPWAKDGKLPTFRKLLKKGKYGYLKSTIPWGTIPAWPSFATGTNPGRHGFYAFYNIDNSYEMDVKISPSNMIRKPTIWDELSKKGRKVGVINVPATYPPEKVNGYMITGMLTTSNDFTYPKSLKDELRRKYGYTFRFPMESSNDVDKFLESLIRRLEENKKVFYDFMDKDLDFLMMVDNGTDIVQHKMWKYLDKENPLNKGKRLNYEKIRNPILEYYKKVDKFLSHIIKKMDKNTILFLMSDHGQGPLRKFININSFLIKEGYMKVKKNLFSRFKYFLFKIGYTPRTIYKLLNFFNLEQKASDKAYFGGKMKMVDKLFFSYDDIDWNRTKAFASGVAGAIRINLKGREKNGTINKGKDYEEIRDEIITKLENLKDNGNNPILFAKKREEIYSGSYLESAPDIIAAASDYYEFFGMHGFSFNSIFKETFGNSGKHTPNGIVLAYKKGLKDNSIIKDVKITDLFPTILKILDCETPKKIDGNLIEEINKIG